MKALDLVLLTVPACLMLLAAPADDERLEQVERGRYLATEVAMCVQCHSPRTPAGALIPSQLFTGGTIPFPAPWTSRDWAEQAPDLVGLPGYTFEQGVRLLTEHVSASGRNPRPPMPPFHMKPEDAEAVVAFLKSLD